MIFSKLYGKHGFVVSVATLLLFFVFIIVSGESRNSKHNSRIKKAQTFLTEQLKLRASKTTPSENAQASASTRIHKLLMAKKSKTKSSLQNIMERKTPGEPVLEFIPKKKNRELEIAYRKFRRILWGLFIFGNATIILLFTGATLGLYGPMPDLQQLENPKTNLATQIISFDGTILGKYYFDDNRTPIKFEEIPTHMVEALIATEDERFYNHSGIDWRGTIRAFVYFGKRGGASTITQQLARQIFVGVRSRNIFKTILQKAQEWVIAVQLERRYTKKEILAMYLNKYDFGYQADGIRSAAKIFFNKTI